MTEIEGLDCLDTQVTHLALHVQAVPNHGGLRLRRDARSAFLTVSPWTMIENATTACVIAPIVLLSATAEAKVPARLRFRLSDASSKNCSGSKMLSP